MFNRILAPVDLSQLDTLERALEVTAKESKLHDAPVTFVSVTMSAPSSVARNPEEFRKRLQEFTEEQSASKDIVANALVVLSHDPTTDLDDALIDTIDSTGSDLVIMASHKPGIVEYFWPANGGKIASHSNASVFVVRDEMATG